MPVYLEILVAIDCSPVDETLIEHVSMLARTLGSRLHLLHVVHSHTMDQERALREAASLRLHRYQKELAEEGIDVEVHLRSGEPEKEILEEMAEHHYDLLAIASHGHRLAERILLGSVSRTLRDKADIPLLLVRSRE